MPEKKSFFNKLRDVLVQEDNPNSPHKVFARMNDNILGGSEKAFSPDNTQRVSSPQPSATNADIVKSEILDVAPLVTENDKRRKQIFSEDNFEDIIWGKK